MDIYQKPNATLIQVEDFEYSKNINKKRVLWGLFSYLVIVFLPNYSLWQELQQIGVPFSAYLEINISQLLFSAYCFLLLPFAINGKKVAIGFLVLGALVFCVSSIYTGIINMTILVIEILVILLWLLVFTRSKPHEKRS